MDLKKIVDELVRAATSRRPQEVARLLAEFHEALKVPGTTLDGGDANRVLEVLRDTYQSGGLDGAHAATHPEAAKLIAKLLENAHSKARDLIEFRQDFQRLHVLLADTTVTLDVESRGSDVMGLLNELRNQREFDMLAKLCDRLLSRGHDDPRIHILYAQSLIDSDRISAASAILGDLLNRPRLPPDLRAKAYGLLGRASKQSYVNHATDGPSHKPAAVREALREAIRCYGAIYDRQNPIGTENSRWAAVNLAGALNLAATDNVSPPVGITDTVGEISTTLIAKFGEQDVVKHWSTQARGTATAIEEDDAWKAVTLAEAYLAAGDWEKASIYFGIFARHPTTTAFQLAGTIRQLEEVWRIKPTDEHRSEILNALRMRLLRLQDGAFQLAPEQVLQSTGSASRGIIYESVLGGPGPTLLKWWDGGIKAAQSVARIRDPRGRTRGTGFIVRGSQLLGSLKDELFVITNHHVVCSEAMRHRDVNGDALVPLDARIYFDREVAESKPDAIRCEAEPVWTSPAHELDFTLLRIKDKGCIARLEKQGPLKLSERAPKLKVRDEGSDKDRAAQVLIIGHTGGEDLHISWRNNDVLSKGPRTKRKNDAFQYLHYRAPTKGGNSGSPVFEEDEWEVVALHHAGEMHESLAEVVQEEPVYKANEGILFTAIRGALEKAKL